MTTVMQSEGTIGGRTWRQYFIVRDGAETIVDMDRAPLGGWFIRHVFSQGAAAWLGMTEAQIVSWRSREQGLTVVGDEVTAATIMNGVDVWIARGAS